MLSHNWPGWKDDRPTCRIACPGVIGLLKISKPIDDLLRFCVCKKDANLAFYLLSENYKKRDRARVSGVTHFCELI